MNKMIQVKYRENQSNNHVEACSNVFNCKPKPIMYIKGDNVIISEFTEESLYNNSTIAIYNTSSEKYDNIEESRQNSKIINNGSIAITIYSNETDPVLVNAVKHPNSNKKLNSSPHIEGPPMTCWESKSEGEEQQEVELKEENLSLPIHRVKTEHFLHSKYILGVKCENHKEAFIYSWSKFHPFSFSTGVTKFGKNNKGILNYPSPTFIDSKEIQKRPDLSKEAILYGTEISDKEGLVLTDKEIMKKFKGIIGDMIKQILKSAFGTPISLKVNLFEPKSTLHRISDYWSFAPLYLNKAAMSNDPLERMKNVIAFAISGFYIPTKQLKPFNPLIGETFQGEFEDGTKVYVEHTSHYPTIARFLIVSENYKLHGHFDFSTDTERFGSRINVYQKGPITIEFPKINQQIIYNMPVIKLLNASSEEGRSAIWINTMLFSVPKNNLKAIIKFATNKNYIHGFEGYIIESFFDTKVKYDHHKELAEANDTKLEFDSKKNKNKILAKVRGSWAKEVKFDDKDVYWDIDKNIPGWIRPSAKVLPSDGRFREDLIWLYRVFNTDNQNEKKMFTEFSQGWKVAIEQTQRSEREIRKKYRPKKNIFN